MTDATENIDHKLHMAIRAADVLKAQLQKIAGDDPDVIRDTIEGEIDLRELIAVAAERNVIEGAEIEGIDALVEKLQARKDRIKTRIELRRVAMLTAMQSGDIPKLVTPAGTISRKAVPPSALILEESQIPADYWKAQEPRLDKKAVLDALKAGTVVPGAQLSNGGETIAIRT